MAYIIESVKESIKVSRTRPQWTIASKAKYWLFQALLQMLCRYFPKIKWPSLASTSASVINFTYQWISWASPFINEVALWKYFQIFAKMGISFFPPKVFWNFTLALWAKWGKLGAVFYNFHCVLHFTDLFSRLSDAFVTLLGVEFPNISFIHLPYRFSVKRSVCSSI